MNRIYIGISLVSLLWLFFFCSLLYRDWKTMELIWKIGFIFFILAWSAFFIWSVSKFNG